MVGRSVGGISRAACSVLYRVRKPPRRWPRRDQHFSAPLAQPEQYIGGTTDAVLTDSRATESREDNSHGWKGRWEGLIPRFGASARRLLGFAGDCRFDTRAHAAVKAVRQPAFCASCRLGRSSPSSEYENPVAHRVLRSTPVRDDDSLRPARKPPERRADDFLENGVER